MKFVRLTPQLEPQHVRVGLGVTFAETGGRRFTAVSDEGFFRDGALDFPDHYGLPAVLKTSEGYFAPAHLVREK